MTERDCKHGRLAQSCPECEVAATIAKLELENRLLRARNERLEEGLNRPSYSVARRSGRTTRMLKEAKRLAEAGRAVYVLEYNHDAARYRAKQNPDLVAIGVKFEPIGGIDFDPKTMRMHGAHPNCALLIEHYAAELQVEQLEEQLLRWKAIAHQYDSCNVASP